MKGPLIDFPDDDVRVGIRESGAHVGYAYND